MPDLDNEMVSVGTGAGDVDTGIAEGDARRSAAPVDTVKTSQPRGEQLYLQELSRLSPCPWQTRVDVASEDDAELDNSVKLHGVFNPLLVTQLEGKYVVIAGMRRYHSALRIGLTRVPVRLLDVNREKAQAISILENTARRNLTPWDEMISVRSLLEADPGLSVRELRLLTGWSVGKAHSRLAMAQTITAEVLENADVKEENMLGLSLTDLESISRESDVSARAKSIQDLVWAITTDGHLQPPTNPEVDPESPEGAGEATRHSAATDVVSGTRRPRILVRHASSLRSADGGRRYVLGVSPDLLTESTAPVVVEDLAKLIEILGPAFDGLAGAVRHWGHTKLPGNWPSARGE